MGANSVSQDYGRIFSVCMLSTALQICLCVHPPFVLSWIIEALMGAYQKPYWQKRKEIQKAIQRELRGDVECHNFVSVPYDIDADPNIEVFKDSIRCFFHLTVGPFYLALIFMLLWLFWDGSIWWYLIGYVIFVTILALFGYTGHTRTHKFYFLIFLSRHFSTKNKYKKCYEYCTCKRFYHNQSSPQIIGRNNITISKCGECNCTKVHALKKTNRC